MPKRAVLSRRWLKRVAILLIVALVAVACASWWVAGQLVAPCPRSIGPPPDDFPAETVEISSRSGSTLAGWYAKGEPGSASIILLHGIRSSRMSMLDRARLFRGVGYSVLLIDFQAHGESSGEIITAGHLERFDARAAVEFAQSRNPTGPVGVVGVSLGGAATLLAVPLPVDAVVLESVYPMIGEAIDNRVRMRLGPLAPIASRLLMFQLKPRLGIKPADLRPIDRISQIGCPVLVMVGDSDHHTTLTETKCLFEAAREPKQLMIFDGATHTDLHRFSPETYKDVVLRFFEKHLQEARQGVN